MNKVKTIFDIKLPANEVSTFIQKCNQYSMTVNVVANGIPASAKSLLGVLALGTNNTLKIIFNDLDYDKDNLEKNTDVIKYIFDTWGVCENE